MELVFVSRALQIPIVKQNMATNDLSELDKIKEFFLGKVSRNEKDSN